MAVEEVEDAPRGRDQLAGGPVACRSARGRRRRCPSSASAAAPVAQRQWYHSSRSTERTTRRRLAPPGSGHAARTTSDREARARAAPRARRSPAALGRRDQVAHRVEVDVRRRRPRRAAGAGACGRRPGSCGRPRACCARGGGRAPHQRREVAVVLDHAHQQHDVGLGQRAVATSPSLERHAVADRPARSAASRAIASICGAMSMPCDRRAHRGGQQRDLAAAAAEVEDAARPPGSEAREERLQQSHAPDERAARGRSGSRRR